MRSSPFLLFFFCGTLIFFFTACGDDPSNVGIGLVGDQSGEPAVVTLNPATMGEESAKDVTGNASRVLAGRVNDPLLGIITTTAYVDFQMAGGLTEAFRAGPTTSAELRFRRDYVYGDTTSAVVLRLNDMPSEWNSDLASADTVLQGGATVAEWRFTLSAADTLVTLELPASWVNAFDATLRSTTFNADFHGFQLEAVSESAVTGFQVERSALRVIAGSDTADFKINKSISGITRSGQAELPPDRTLIQDGVGSVASIDFAFSDSLWALNRAVFQFTADTLTFEQNTPVNFYRPVLNELRLIGVTDEGLPVFTSAGNPVIDIAARLDQQGRFIFSSRDLAQVVQRMVTGTIPVDRFQIRMPAANTITPAILFNTNAQDYAPKAILTVTPFAE